MKKRFAIFAALGVAAAMVTGSLAMSSGVLTASSADVQSRPEPHVRTVHRTVTVHRTADPKPGRTITLPAPGATVSSVSSSSESTSSSSSDDAFEESESEQETGHEGAEQESTGDMSGSSQLSGQGGDTGDD
jgi:hypothetical protein